MRSHWSLLPYTMWLHYVASAALRASLSSSQECQKGEYVNTTSSFVPRIFENIVDNLTRTDSAAQKSSALDCVSACLVDVRAFQEILACHQDPSTGPLIASVSRSPRCRYKKQMLYTPSQA